MNQELIALIVDAVQEITQQQEGSTLVEVDSTTPLYGQEGLLDSIGLVTLVVTVEQAIEDRFDISISLADEKAMSQRISPYKTVASLAEYAAQLLAAGA
jgi:acyl carrier protein